MGKTSNIEWTDATFNPWRGCSKVSAGCANCYAERDSKRWGLDLFGPDKERKELSTSGWRKPIKWNEEAHDEGNRRKVFCASFADVFEDRPDLVKPRLKLWLTILATKNLDWLLLTKRPENIDAMAWPAWRKNGWPSNVWLGTSVEDQAAADVRIPHLVKVKCVVRFLSCEPLLGPVTFRPTAGSLSEMMRLSAMQKGGPPLGARPALLGGISWVIAGGESGPKARPMATEWARSVRDQCQAAGIPFFMKQLGGWPDKRGSMLDLPEDLRVRRFPEVEA